MTAIITDLASVKAWGGHGTTTNDTRLTELVNSVDFAFQTWMKRPAEQVSRVELIPVIHEFDRMVVLQASPIVSITTVIISATRDFTGAPESASDYTSDAEAGTLHFDFDLTAGINTMQVTYVGGMAADVAAFKLAYPDIHHWANVQVEYEWERRNNAGATSVTEANSNRSFTAGVQILKGAIEAMAPYRRVTIR